MGLTNNDAELDRLWPMKGHGSRHSFDCHSTMLMEYNNQHIFAEVVCKCGLDVWLQLRQIPTTNNVYAERVPMVPRRNTERKKRFAWM